MVNYQEARVKLTNTQLNKLKSAAKNRTGTILRLNKKNFGDEELPHKLFLTTRQTAKIRNAFASNMSTDIKLSKAQINHSGGSFGSWLGNPGKKALSGVSVKGASRGENGFTLFISNEDMNNIIKTIKSLEDSGVLIDGVTETVKGEIKKQEGGFLGALLAPLAASLVQPVISSAVKG